jgi:SpoVK/Ycf46/Vps4 family AAA+-type ATPase
LGAKLTEVARGYTKIEGALVLTGRDIQIPEAAMPHTAFLSPPPPGRQDYADLIQQIYRDLSSRMQVKVEMSKKDLNQLLNNLHGLTLLEAEKILTKAIIEDGRLAPDDLQAVIKAKKAVIEREGLLEYFPVEASMSDIAGLARLKTWLAQRKSIITEPKRAEQYGLVFPKGILLLGVPGCGKSLCAKAVAMEWGLPLLKMDPSNLYNKYIGESEKNFKRAMVTSEKMSPVVLWIDEIEKAFSSGDEDGGVSLRVLGLFLSWMQERKGDVFVVATCNDVTRLPPELLRKGRFDEIFFVDLPQEETREAIFKIHLSRRGYDPRIFDLCKLAEATDGFSGAEIEQVVVSALYTSFSEDTPFTTNLLLEEVQKTRPLLKTRAEHIQALRQWAKGRTVSAQ